jgi:glycosyltransferase involved in cell wall biosynthesis
MGGGDVAGPDWKPDQNMQAKFLTPYALRNADHITSWSRLMAGVVQSYCRAETPITVIHGGIHLERFKPDEKPRHLLERYGLSVQDKVIFSPRLMRPLSNITSIADAFYRASTHNEYLKLLIAAPGQLVDSNYQNEVAQLVQSHKLEKNVQFIGPLEHEEIADHFRLADVTVSIPSIDGTPMTVLESMACGTPTVIGNLPDYDQEYFENEKTTLMVDINDPNEIADAISRFLTDEELTGRITTEARRRVLETGGYEYQMGKMEKIYESLQRI